MKNIDYRDDLSDEEIEAAKVASRPILEAIKRMYATLPPEAVGGKTLGEWLVDFAFTQNVPPNVFAKWLEWFPEYAEIISGSDGSGVGVAN